MSTDVVAAPGLIPGPPVTTEVEERVSVAPQWKPVWWRFRKHRLAVVSACVLIMLNFSVIFADFLAYSDPLESEAQRGLIPPSQSSGSIQPASIRPFRRWWEHAIHKRSNVYMSPIRRSKCQCGFLYTASNTAYSD